MEFEVGFVLDELVDIPFELDATLVLLFELFDATNDEKSIVLNIVFSLFFFFFLKYLKF